MNPLKELTGKRKYFITHNDLDGILSWLFLEQKGYKLGGIYDMKGMYLKDGISLDDCFAVDLDMSLPGLPSVGHHFRLFSNEEHLNPNTTYGISDPSQFQSLNNYMKPPRFKSKCPLPMILILHALTNTPLPKDPESRLWFLYADSLYQSFEKYKRNVKNWLNILSMQELIEDLESGVKDKIESSILVPIEAFGKGLTGRGFKSTKSKTFPQCSFKPLELPLLEPLLKYLKQTLYGSSEINIPDVVTAFDGYRYRIHMNDWVYQKLEQKFHQGILISHGLVSQTVVSVTLADPLNDNEDALLIRSIRSTY